MSDPGVKVGRPPLDDVEGEDEFGADAVPATDAERTRLQAAVAVADRAGPEDWIPAARVIRR